MEGFHNGVSSQGFLTIKRTICSREWGRMHRVKRLFITALFSSIIFVANFFLPAPVNNLLIVVQAVVLALAALFVGRGGASYVGLVGGVLSALSRPAFGPFTFVFTFMFGVLVDVFFLAFKVAAPEAKVDRNKAILAMALSTAIMALTTYYTFSILTNILPLDLMLAGMMLFLGVGSGITAGYAAAYLWNKYLQSLPL